MATTLTTATVETAAPRDIVITCNNPLLKIDNVVATLAGVKIPLTEILFGTTTIVRVLTPFVNAGVVTISATLQGSPLGVSDVLALSGQAVTNNVA